MSKKIIYQELLKEEQELIQTLEKVRGLRKYYELNFDINIDSDNNSFANSLKVGEAENSAIYKDYDPKAPYIERVFYVLNELKEATSKEVKEKWLEIEPKLPHVKANRESRRQLWLLADDGIISKKKSGKSNQNIYYLNEKNHPIDQDKLE